MKKTEKKSGDIIILQKCTKNYNMLSCSSDMTCDGCNYFLFLVIFCPFIPLTAQKITISK